MQLQNRESRPGSTISSLFKDAWRLHGSWQGSASWQLSPVDAPPPFPLRSSLLRAQCYANTVSANDLPLALADVSRSR